MSKYTVGIIGTGPDPEKPTVQSFAMGYRHAESYCRNEHCRVVACADVVPENAAAFAREFDLGSDDTYEDFQVMLDEVEPDIVSVTVPPQVHEEIVVGCAQHESVQAIHCEKPIAHSWASAQRTVQSCWRWDTQLTFNRQRRFGLPFTKAKELVDDGEIGSLQRIEIRWGDLFDTGAHSVDLAGMFNDDRPAEWVIAQLDYREEDVRFGRHQENQVWAQWRYDNGVFGTMSTGDGSSLIDASFLLRGDEGSIRIDIEGGPMLELQQGGSRAKIDVAGETLHNVPHEDGDRFGSTYHDRAIDDAVDALRDGRESKLCGRIGLNTAEILFGGYESVRRRGRVDLPHDVVDDPLEAMVAAGALSPVSDTASD